jgi:iron complex transport system ATP-binding protein
MIELNDLAAGYPGRAVLSGVSLTFSPGEVTAILGPNGSGKTTLLRTVLGLQRPQGGEILLDGHPLDALTPKERAQRMAYLAQSRPVPNITVGRMVLHGRFPHLGYPRNYRPEDYAAVEQAMERAGVSDLAHRPLSELSGGQRQRVYLAMALAQEAPYVFFDEPTTYLDVGRQLETMDTALTLAGEGKAVVMVLHDLPLALRTAHKLVILDDGGVKAAGSAEEIFQSGVLNTVFGVNLRRLATENGWRYYYE